MARGLDGDQPDGQLRAPLPFGSAGMLLKKPRYDLLIAKVEHQPLTTAQLLSEVQAYALWGMTLLLAGRLVACAVNGVSTTMSPSKTRRTCIG